MFIYISESEPRLRFYLGPVVSRSAIESRRMLSILCEHLYDAAWPQPIRKLAAKCKVSDVALAKTCRKLKVPVPGRGYWAKLAAGKPLHRRPPLPPL